ncbi:MAG: pyrroline-5-carboxylate reductase family protein [Thermoguttaceae bacterium]|jgi:pyrroline-5-carboxylate reductase
MSSKTVGFIGGGRIVRVFLGGWRKAGKLPGTVVVSDTDSHVIETIKREFSTVDTLCDGNLTAMEQDIVFLAVHPPVIADVLAKLKNVPKSTTILISLAPKFTMGRLTEILGGFNRLARMIPNAPSIVGEGFNPMAFSASLTEFDREIVRDLLAPLGECLETEERKLEAFAVLTGMGPTYFWPLLYELVALCESFGLSESEAIAGLRQMLAGTVATMSDSGLGAEAVQDLVPVKPLADVVPSILDAYRTKLSAVFDKIKP